MQNLNISKFLNNRADQILQISRTGVVTMEQSIISAKNNIHTLHSISSYFSNKKPTYIWWFKKKCYLCGRIKYLIITKRRK